MKLDTPFEIRVIRLYKVRKIIAKGQQIRSCPILIPLNATPLNFSNPPISNVSNIPRIITRTSGEINIMQNFLTFRVNVLSKPRIRI
jgi:hypothetical protein